MLRWLPVVVLLWVFPAAAESITLKMDFFYGGTKIADVTDTLRLSEDGAAYEIESYAAAVGLAKLLHGDTVRRSSGTMDAVHGLLMTAYYEKRGGRAAQRAAVQAEGVLSLQRGDSEQREETVETPVFDYLTMLYRSHVLGAATGGEVWFTNGWRFKAYDYQVRQTETVSTPLGDMEAVLLTRDSTRGERKIWLAPALDYLPVRAFVSDKGHEFTTVLRSIER